MNKTFYNSCVSRMLTMIDVLNRQGKYPLAQTRTMLSSKHLKNEINVARKTIYSNLRMKMNWMIDSLFMLT